MKYLLLVLVLVLAGCSGELDGTYMKDKVGDVYMIKHRVGDLYFINQVDAEDVKQLNDFIIDEVEVSK